VSIVTTFANTIADRLEPIFDKKMDLLIDKALAMLGDKLPELAGEITEAALRVTFENTHVDEVTNQVADSISAILDGIPFLRPRP